jgi:hypothetical protein
MLMQSLRVKVAQGLVHAFCIVYKSGWWKGSRDLAKAVKLAKCITSASHHTPSLALASGIDNRCLWSQSCVAFLMVVQCVCGNRLPGSVHGTIVGYLGTIVMSVVLLEYLHSVQVLLQLSSEDFLFNLRSLLCVNCDTLSVGCAFS